MVRVLYFRNAAAEMQNGDSAMIGHRNYFTKIILNGQGSASTRLFFTGFAKAMI